MPHHTGATAQQTAAASRPGDALGDHIVRFRVGPAAGDAPPPYGRCCRLALAAVCLLVAVAAVACAPSAPPVPAAAPATTAAMPPPAPAEAASPAQPASSSPVPAGGGNPPPAADLAPEAPPRLPPGIPGVTAAAYVVMEAETGAVLAEHYAHDRRSPASLTKIMTALLVIERAGLDELVTVPDAVTTLRASALMGVPPGERLTVRDLLYGLMLPSGNDAGIALAVHVAGDEPAFAAQMNQRARELGMRDTRFLNSHGLDFRDWGSPYTTAHDLALVTREAMQHEAFRRVVATRAHTAQGTLAVYGMRNINSFLSAYPGATGAKTGWTRRAGATIAATAARGGRSLIAIALGAAERDSDARRLLDFGYASHRQ